MPVQKAKPTSAGRRHVVSVTHDGLHKGRPYGPLTENKRRINGRNNAGRITVRHRGGSHKQRYRLIDFKRSKTDIPARVERLEYDPNRSALIALICYQDGERAYILAPRGLKVNDTVMSSPEAPISPGNTMPLDCIPLGTLLHNVELKPGKGGQLARSAGCSVKLSAKDGDYATVKLQSGEVRHVDLRCRATIGQVSNSDHNLRSLGKAGASRWRGRRPTVRGVAMNPVDHPHGGGEGKTSGGRHPVSPTGVPAKGYRTRNNKRTDFLIVKRRKSKRR